MKGIQDVIFDIDKFRFGDVEAISNHLDKIQFTIGHYLVFVDEFNKSHKNDELFSLPEILVYVGTDGTDVILIQQIFFGS